MNIQTLANDLIWIFGPVAILSLLLIEFYLVRKRLYTWLDIIMTIHWAKLLINYKKHTKQNAGRIGFIYYIFLISFWITCLSFFIVLSFQLEE
jgi:hypothetical protein